MDTFLHLGTKDTAYASGRVRMSLDDRRRHMLVSGRSGTGKSTLLANIFAQEANSGRGCLLLDPHGELAEQALELVPPRRIRKTIYFNPADTDHPISFNVLADVAPEHRAARCAEIVGAFHSVWADSWGPRLEYILYNTVATLLETGDATLLCIPQMLLNKVYRETVTARIQDPVVAGFWRDELPSIEKKFGFEAISPVLNKIGQVLASPVVRNIVGQPKPSFSPRHLIDNNYLIIANFSKGLLGAQHANLLGALLIASFGAAAMSRADLRPDDRRDFALIIDEFPNYTTNSFTYLLAEARKYRLSLTLAHQYLDQMSDQVRAAVLGNVGSIIAFRAGAQDAEVFARELHPLRPEQVTETANYQAWSRVLLHGQPSEAFLLSTPPPPKPHGHGQKIIANSRIHFATPRAKAEARIVRFLRSPQRKPADPGW